MEYLLHHAKDPIGLLCSAGIGHQRKTLDLPSWVQDWSFASRSYFKAEWYSANTDISPPIRLDVDSATPHLDGEVFDEIAHKSSIYSTQNDTEPLYEALDVANWLAEVEALAVGSRDPYYTGEGRSEALFRTIVGDHYGGKNDRPTAKQCEMDYATLKKYLRKYPWWIRQKEAVANVYQLITRLCLLTQTKRHAATVKDTNLVTLLTTFWNDAHTSFFGNTKPPRPTNSVY